MSIVRRIRDITVATLNERLEKAEDPVRMIDQFLWSTREDIIQAEKLHQQYTNHSNHLRAQWLQAESQKERREQQAMTALKAGEENMARFALHEKATADERAAQYKDLFEQSRQHTLELEEQLREMRSEYQAVYDKREYYAARMESIRLQQRLNSRFGGYGESGPQPGAMFRRMEDRINDLETEAKSIRDVRRMGHEMDGSGLGSTVKSVIDRELDELKRKLQKEGWSS
ncbi:phage shock protein A [Paenibacillus sp. MY03]|jgi:phage shock protein A|uniref:Phage-shock protein n=1 Tax=Paenibacillus agaridevorans TaxID=171404 RepID=A0A2R5F4Q3_9BACL|nr:MULTISPECIES: PspA/IM30 family protein [Paenibacillus]OUS73996.1 phage shock protein A [Paenibacillus sp. MY03]GBG11181.1 phage-shock protein [Paenibacillus agaridevorans]